MHPTSPSTSTQIRILVEKAALPPGSGSGCTAMVLLSKTDTEGEKQNPDLHQPCPGQGSLFKTEGQCHRTNYSLLVRPGQWSLVPNSRLIHPGESLTMRTRHRSRRKPRGGRRKPIVAASAGPVLRVAVKHSSRDVFPCNTTVPPPALQVW